jgi:hypothetical protein
VKCAQCWAEAIRIFPRRGSLTYIFSKEDGADNFRAATDEYLKVALETKEFLVTSQKKDPEGKPEVVEALIH